jgi:hypothetical protein
LSLKSELGRKVGPYQDKVTGNRILAFCRAIGVQNCDVAPPTFLTVFRKGEFDLFQLLGIELSRILHAEQEYQYENPIQSGDTVHFETVVTHVLEKQGSSSKMQFLTFETEFHSERGPQKFRVGKSKTTIVVKG